MIALLIQSAPTATELGIRWVSPGVALLFLLMMVSIPILLTAILAFHNEVKTWAFEEGSRITKAMSIHHPRVLHHSGR